MKQRLAGTLAALAAGLSLAACERADPGADAADEAIVVYSARAEHLIKPVFDYFTERTGIEVTYTTDSEQPLIQRLIAEGDATPADLLMTVDAGNLWYAAEAGVLASTDSAVLREAIPAPLRDTDGRWFGLSVRARTIVYDPDKVAASDIVDYAGLADPKWRGRLCLRTSKKVYNQSLVAMLIRQHGVARTEEIVRGWVANLATDVFSNDTKLMEAIVDGQCEIGIVNSYYYGRLQRDNNRSLPLRLYWPAAGTGGVHVNVAGAGIVRASKQPERARELLEWLAGPEAQGMFAGLNLEFPANPAVEPDPVVASWGEFVASDEPLENAGRLQSEAVRLMDRSGYR